MLKLTIKKSMQFASILLLILAACSNDDIVMPNTQENVFECFWDIMDKRYVFFEEKNLNWDSIYQTYSPKISPAITNEELVQYFSEIIEYINDGHVDITINSYCIISSPSLKYGWMDYDGMCSYYNFENIVHTDKYILAQDVNSVLYFNLKTFNLGDNAINKIKSEIKEYDYSNGIIMDVRNNTGGDLIDGLKICSFFYEGEKTLLYEKYKTGYSHNDFTDYKAIKMNGTNIIGPNTPIVLLANQSSYSMANYFSFILKDLSNCTFIGEHTGGGGGSRAEQPLPNGWILSYSERKSYSTKYELMEDGLEPDITLVPDSIFWRDEHTVTGKDLQFEAGIKYLNQQIL